ncbi:ABC transporter substrate-binding protein [Pigmentiphaga soli]|uniref:ABC transporter substrate-binding protein n=1 Tax=Pigmentiphaga soli TaxID=1007095 RepID=A0ABP8HAU1_9BURK
MKYSLARTGAALLLAFTLQPVLPAAAQTADAAWAGIARYQGADRQQKLIEGAKKEGTLTLYTSMDPPDQQVLSDAFQKKYGIQVRTWRGLSEAVLQKTVAENRARRYEVDVVDNNGPEMEALRREHLLQAVYSPYQADLRPGALPDHREWAGGSTDIIVQAYNTNLIKKEDLPKTWNDLLDPKWKGKLAIEARDQHWFAGLLDILGRDQGMKLFGQIVDTNGISVRQGHTLLANLVASGEVPLALTVYNYSTADIKKRGGPIEHFVISPAVGALRAIGVTRTAPHPYAALLYYDFLLSPEGQQLLLDRARAPNSTKIDSPWRNIDLRMVDPGKSLDMYDKWTKDYETAVTKRVTNR